ncbi:MAG: xanthine dehydrogenase [Rhodospirillaceae bacterium]|nr:xanthine dehydrogenase [Rhodospirillaceae bacterium]
MKSSLLTELQSRIAAKHSCALVTETITGAQAIVGGGGTAGALVLSPESLGHINRLIAADKSSVIDGTNLFVRVYSPSPRMVIVGAVHIAQSLVPLAQLAGFETIVIDPRGAFLSANELAGATAIEEWPDEGMTKVKADARTAVVTLTHDPKLDDPALAAALRSPAFYIGALGSRKTHEKRLLRLRGEGFNETELARIHGPVGLDINAVSPAEIAVSIVAQVIDELRADTK